MFWLRNLLNTTLHRQAGQNSACTTFVQGTTVWDSLRIGCTTEAAATQTTRYYQVDGVAIALRNTCPTQPNLQNPFCFGGRHFMTCSLNPTQLIQLCHYYNFFLFFDDLDLQIIESIHHNTSVSNSSAQWAMFFMPQVMYKLQGPMCISNVIWAAWGL